MKVRIELLEKASAAVFKHLRANGIEYIETDKDFYWDIGLEELYDPYREPRATKLGQLSHDLTEIQKVAEGEAEPIGYVLVWLSALYRLVGESHAG